MRPRFFSVAVPLRAARAHGQVLTGTPTPARQTPSNVSAAEEHHGSRGRRAEHPARALNLPARPGTSQSVRTCRGRTDAQTMFHHGHGRRALVIPRHGAHREAGRRRDPARRGPLQEDVATAPVRSPTGRVILYALIVGVAYAALSQAVASLSALGASEGAILWPGAGLTLGVLLARSRREPSCGPSRGQAWRVTLRTRLRLAQAGVRASRRGAGASITSTGRPTGSGAGPTSGRKTARSPSAAKAQRPPMSTAMRSHPSTPTTTMENMA